MIVLMQCVAEAVMHKGIRGLAELVPGAPYLYDVAGDAVKRMKERKRTADLRNEVLSTANASLDEVKRTAAEVAREVAAAGPVEDRLALEMYLTQLPGAIRQSLKRPDDPSGKTVPADFRLDDAAELLRRLPQRVAKFRLGDSLPGKPGWKLIEFLGSGGFGEVWLARNPTLTALQGAVKFGLDPAARERLLRHEGSLINRVMEHGRHPHVVPLIDAHLEGDTPWLMYEYVPGGDLGGLVLAWHALPPVERLKRVLAALQTLAVAVSHFHRLNPPIVHRDLKPTNVLAHVESHKAAIVDSGRYDVTTLRPDDFSLRIADFGIGGIAAAASLAMEASRTGSTRSIMTQLGGSYTPLYASPQQQRGEPPDPRDDVHALGVIGYQMLTGKLDATLGVDYAKTLRRLGVPQPFIELLGDCAAHDPENRLRDATELAMRLAALSSDPMPVRQSTAASAVASPQTAATAEPAASKEYWTPRKLLFLTIIGAQIMVVAIVGMALTLNPNARSSRLIPPPEVVTSERKTAEFLRTIRTPGDVREFRISPDGKSLAISCRKDGSRALFLADVSGKKPQLRVDEPDTNPGAFGFSPDSQRLAVATKTGARVMSVSNGVRLFELVMPTVDLRGCSVLCRVVEGLGPLKVPELHPHPRWVSYSPNGDWILMASGWVYAQNVTTPGADGTMLVNKDGRELAVDKDSQFLFDSTGPTAKHLAVVRPNSGPVAIFDVARWQHQSSLGDDSAKLGAFDPLSNTFASWDGNEVTQRTLGTGTKLQSLATTSAGDPLQLLFLGDRRLAAIGTKLTLAFDLDRNSVASWPAQRETKILRAATNLVGTLFAFALEDGQIRVSKMGQLQGENEVVSGNTGTIHDIQFTPDGNILIASGTDGVFVWSVGNHKPAK